MASAAQTVLVVDDEPMVREVLTQYLQHDGFGVVEAADGDEAVDLLERHRPDLVLLDLMLPKRHGLDVLRQLRNAKVETPVLILSGLTEPTKKVQGLGIGADDYIRDVLTQALGEDKATSVIDRILLGGNTTYEMFHYGFRS